MKNSNQIIHYCLAFLLSVLNSQLLSFGVKKSELVIKTVDGVKISATLTKPV